MLIVEDEAAVRMLVAEMLQDLGYRVLEARDGPSGLEALHSAPRVDLVVIDVGLPGMNGREVAEGARKWQHGLKLLLYMRNHR